jgi:hypothetical protein
VFQAKCLWVRYLVKSYFFKLFFILLKQVLKMEIQGYYLFIP